MEGAQGARVDLGRRKGRRMKTYYVTKYALTQGIIPVKGTITDKGVLKVRDSSFQNRTHTSFLPSKTWVETWEEAVEEAERLREKKILSLEKQLLKLKMLEWEKP